MEDILVDYVVWEDGPKISILGLLLLLSGLNLSVKT